MLTQRRRGVLHKARAARACPDTGGSTPLRCFRGREAAVTAPAVERIPPPQLSPDQRVDVVLDQLAAVTDDLGSACNLLWAFVQADGACELEHVRKRARAYLLVQP
jgi:hypothetical protein